MSSNSRVRRKRLHQSGKKPDRRILRTRDRLGDALVELIQERPFDSITVQQVLDRAGVGRSTFYVHYRDKNDLLLSDADEFFAAMSSLLARRQESSERVAPVREFFTHLAEGRRLYDALLAAGKLDNILELARGHFARGIGQRLAASPRHAAMVPEKRAALAHALAGALLSLLKWWVDTGMRTPPAEMDELFHRLVYGRALP